MRKVSLIFLSIFYFLVASGFSMNLHYCAGKLKGVSLLQSEKDGCCGTKKKSKGCCKEKTFAYKIKDNHKSTAKVIIPNTSVKQFLAFYIALDFTNEKSFIDLCKVPDCNAPPFLDPEPVFLLNRNFRI